ncbi:MAG: hypothetical protein HZA90_10700 [Verrucomicrobia bacterium]|nr:hypothetical protein [Verrucomicrobiota bacterium]
MLLQPSRAAETNAPAELWLTNAAQYPAGLLPGLVQTSRFENAHAEFIAGVVKILWTPLPTDSAGVVTLKLSADEPGHWPARDWRSYPMTQRGPNWETLIPVDSFDVPLIYFLQTVSAKATNVSLMRLCHPQRLGLERPTRVFWPFLEGFEEGLESWRLLAGGRGSVELRTASEARNGHAALSVVIPPDRFSATVGTTRLRGWRLVERSATGVALWMRTREGTGRARFTLLADAFTTRQTVAPREAEIPVQAAWQKIELPFTSFAKLPLGQVDFLTIELLGEPGREFLLDDLYLLGRWRLD